MSSFKEYMNKSLNEEREELRKKNKKVEENLNESSLSKYLKKSKVFLEEEVKSEEDEYLDDNETETASDAETDSEDTEEETDNESDYESDEDEEAMGSSCPIPTKDQTVNMENRQKAIDEFAYGPENIAETNDEFWNNKKAKFMTKTTELAKAKKCGNCAAFTIKTAILACLDKGIDQTMDENDTWDADKENRGYCDFLDFKCHAQRTCDSWVEGGPLKDSE
jgi:hypothetical protein